MSTQPPWLDLLRSAQGANAALPSARYAQLATLRDDGRPANRTVVVRDVRSAGEVVVSTDERSEKTRQLAAQPWAELCWLFPTTHEQFRILGQVHAVGPENDPDGLRACIWRALPPPSQLSFTAPPPGKPLDEGWAVASSPPENPPACFVLLVMTPDQVEYLDVRPAPHIRLRFVRGEEGWSTRALNP